MRVLAILLGLLTVSSVGAETFVFLQNAGDEPLCVEEARVEGGLASSAWKQPSGGRPRPERGCRYEVRPGERIEYLRFNRDKGVTSGRTFFFRTRVRTADGHALELKQRVRGQTIGSHLHQTLGEAPEVDDRRRRTYAWVTGKRVIPVHFQALSRGTGFDDVEYVFGRARPMPEARGPEVRILTLNAYMIPGISKAIDERARRLPVELLGRDVIIFSEIFDDSARRVLVSGLQGEYPWRTTILNPDRGIEQDGGVMILSRWPIVFQDELYFEGSRGTDRFAAKGVMYACIQRPEGRLHVFGTHTQSAADDLGSAVVEEAFGGAGAGLLNRPAVIRLRQLRQMHAFVESRRIPPEEPVILAGDMNVDHGHAGGNEYRSMLRALRAEEVPVPVRRPTFDPANALVDEDARPEYLDYVLFRTDHARPLSGSRSTVRRLLTDEPFEEGIRDLSDHHAVESLLILPGRSPPVADGSMGRNRREPSFLGLLGYGR